jgi:hypothetical protein
MNTDNSECRKPHAPSFKLISADEQLVAFSVKREANRK